MKETWLASNNRAFVTVLVFPLTMAIGGWLGCYLVDIVAWKIVAGLVGTLATLAAGSLVLLGSQPRIAYRDGELLLYLGSANAERVPIEFVEVFFRGQAASLIAGQSEHQVAEGPETSTVVVRIAERAEPWHKRPTRAMLGQWCGGYITVRGTWCEPITADVIQGLNRRLIEIHRQRAAVEEETE